MISKEILFNDLKRNCQNSNCSDCCFEKTCSQLSDIPENMYYTDFENIDIE